MNREQWLTDVAKQAEPFFRGFKLPPYHVTCGWPLSGGMGNRRRVVGQCFGVESSPVGTCQVFISPLLDKPLEVAGTLLHEMAHVAAGSKAKHGKWFVKVCTHVGLTKGKPTSVMPGERLNEALTKIVDRQGKYPHVAIQPVLKKIEKASSVVGLVCECGCRVTISLKWLEEAGLPTCGCGEPMTLKEKE